MWAVGVLLYEMIYGTNPFFAEYVADVVEKISEAKYSFDSNITVSSSLKDLIKRLLC